MKPIKELVYNQSREVNASFTMAGAACLLYIACGLFCPEDYGGYLHIKSFVYLSNLVVPMLCFWAGMLLRWKFDHPNGWLVAVVALVAAVEYGVYVWLNASSPSLLNANHLRIAVFLTGFALPWKYLSRTGDPDGWKSLALCMLSTLVFCVMNYVSAPANQAGYPTQMKIAIEVVWPVALLLPVWFVTEFALSKAGQQVGARLGGDDIPHFGLALAAVMADVGEGIVRMDLDAEVGEGVDELDQQGELVAGVVIDMLPDKASLVFAYEVGDAAALPGAVRDDGFVAGHAGEFPALADVVLVGFDMLERGDFLAAPDDSLQDGFEFQWIHGNRENIFIRVLFQRAKGHKKSEPLRIFRPILDGNVRPNRPGRNMGHLAVDS